MDRRLLLASAGAVGLSACMTTRAQGRARPSALGDALEAGIASAFERCGFVPGMAVAAYSPDVAFAGGFGVTDIQTRQPVSPHSAFYIASSTKPLTALAIARLHDRGMLDLGAPLSDLAPGLFPEAIRPTEVRLRNLLSHTSGIENEAIVLRLAFTGQHDPSILHDLLAQCRANGEAPLGQFQYSNVGYNIATILSDELLGVAWQDMLRREVFSPTGMTHTSARISDAQARRWSLAKGHWASSPEGVQILSLQKSDRTMHSAGGVIMSANDALKWLELMIEGGRVGGRRVAGAGLVASTLEALALIPGEEDYAAHHYGLGWYLSTYRGEPMVHHFGDYDGFRAHVSYLPQRRIGAAVFVNESSASWWIVHGAANYIFDRLTGQADAEARMDAALNSAAQEREEWINRIAADRTERANLAWGLSRARAVYAGVYENLLLGRMEVTDQDGDLVLRLGQLQSSASAAPEPEAVSVEFFPYRRGRIAFESDGAAPSALRFRGARFERVL